MDDLDFLLLASHLFETRVRTSCDEDSLGIGAIATWLRDIGKLRRYEDTDPEEDVTIPLGDPRVMDMVNIYNPCVNMVFNIESDPDALIIKRLRLQSSSRVTYRMVNPDIALKIPVLHGGRIIVQGDLDIKHLVDLVKRSPVKTVMATDIQIEGSRTSLDAELRRSLTDTLVNIIYNTEDADMFGFSMTHDEGIDPDAPQTRGHIQIRGWVVESTPMSISVLNSQSSVK